MISISLCMIVKNEENCLDQCLSSVKHLVDEFIIVDTGSTDRTKDIIKKYADTIYQFEWINDFSAARNYAFSLATKDYILWLDADDVLLPKDQELFIKLKKTLSSDIDYISMIYDITFNEKGECILSIPRDKLIKNKMGFYWKYFVHEQLMVWGKSYASQIHITHTSDHGHYSRYLNNYEQRLADGYELLPHEKYFYGGELFMSKEYEKCITVLEDFLENPSDDKFEIERSYDFLRTCYEKTGQIEKGISTMLRSFCDLTPTADKCFYLANLFLSKKQYQNAIFWYSAITNPTLDLKNQSDSLLVSCYLQLCVCYYAIGLTEKSKLVNAEAKKLDPNNASVLYNETFFKTLS